jgi:hypothetical protein
MVLKLALTEMIAGADESVSDSRSRTPPSPTRVYKLPGLTTGETPGGFRTLIPPGVLDRLRAEMDKLESPRRT